MLQIQNNLTFLSISHIFNQDFILNSFQNFHTNLKTIHPFLITYNKSLFNLLNIANITTKNIKLIYFYELKIIFWIYGKINHNWSGSSLKYKNQSKNPRQRSNRNPKILRQNPQHDPRLNNPKRLKPRSSNHSRPNDLFNPTSRPPRNFQPFHLTNNNLSLKNHID